MENDAIKQVIIIRSDLEMSRGKTAAQAAHASLMSYFEAERMDNEVAKEWLDTGEKRSC
jgi:peptidyl-tRNA hydrolase (EC 3.1.1.29)